MGINSSSKIENKEALNEEIRIEVIRPEDKELVLKFAKETFYADEPINMCLKMGNGCPEIDASVTEYIEQDCSFKALNSRGEIVGIYLNGLIKKSTKKKHPEKCDHLPNRQLMEFFEYVEQRFDVFDLYPNIDEYLYHWILSVHPSYRQHKIASKLLKCLDQYIQVNGIEVGMTHCTGAYSAHSSEAAGYEKVFELPYADYVVDGKNPILPEPPHKAFTIYVKKNITK